MRCDREGRRLWRLRWRSICSDERLNLRIEGETKNLLQLRLHVLILVGNIQYLNRRQLEAFEPGREPNLVFAFHREDNIGPTKIVFTNTTVRFRPHTSRPDLHSRIVAVKMLGRHAALLIHGADEQNPEATIRVHSTI